MFRNNKQIMALLNLTPQSHIVGTEQLFLNSQQNLHRLEVDRFEYFVAEFGFDFRVLQLIDI